MTLSYARLIAFPLLLSAVCTGGAMAFEMKSADLPGLARALADSSLEMKSFAARTLLSIVFRDLQIRSALNDFDHHAHRLAATIGNPDADPGLVNKMFRNLEMWGGTVDYHLDRASTASRYQKVRTRWAATVAVWNNLREAAGQAKTPRDLKAILFEKLHSGQE